MNSRNASEKLVWWGCVVVILFLISSDSALGQNTSNKGKDFWLGYGNHVQGFSNMSQRMALYITSDVNTTGQVEIPGIGYASAFSVTANSITVVDIPQEAYLKDEGAYDLGIHVTSARPIVVYSHIYNQAVSGASLILPVNTLGREYYSINYQQTSNDNNAHSYFFIVGVEDNTEVEVTPSADTKGGWTAGQTYSIRLNRGQVYQVLGVSTGRTEIGTRQDGTPVYDHHGVDLTGSKIRSISTTGEPCKRIAVFSGSGKIAIGCSSNTRSSDNLFQQLYPTAAWGKRFVTAPLKERNYDIYRIIKSDPSASVKLNGTVIPASSFTNNFYFEFSSTSANYVESDKSIQVVQYSVTQNQNVNCTALREPYGDPEMIYLNPIEQTLEKITLYSSGYYNIQAHFVNVVIETAAAGSLRLDGSPYTGGFTPIPNNPTYSYAQISVGEGVHTLSADRGFNAIAYGFGQAESYGYAAGANVKSLAIEAESKVTNRVEANGCIGELFDMKVYLLYATNKLVWDLGNGSTPLVVNNPSPSGTVIREGKEYYVYQYPNSPISFNAVGDYSIEVTANKPLADGCGSTEELVSDFSIYSSPKAEFSFPQIACLGTEVVFTDASDGLGPAIKSWSWNFGDPYATSASPNTSSIQHPTHVFSKAGTYTVKLQIQNESTCDPAFVEHVITIKDNASGNFSISAQACEGQPVVFTDLSSVSAGNGSIVKWSWDFNDPNATPDNPNTSEDRHPTHLFSRPGVYHVKLLLETEFGCRSSVTKEVIISPKPKVDFALPKACVDDQVIFADLSTIDNNTAAQFTYLWDFGDGSPVTINNTRKNPSHRYTEAKVYTVSLTVTSATGCSFTASKEFTVNGKNPVAVFQAQGPTELCSNQAFSFINKSTVGFGKITRLEWYFDATKPEEVLVDDDPEFSEVVSHKYPVHHELQPRQYTVRLLAYSGSSCVDATELQVMVKGLPELQIDQPPAVCMDSKPFRLQVFEKHNFQGTYHFSGRGVSASGIFDPAAAGPGKHTITCSFTAAGCTVSETLQLELFPTPALNTLTEVYVLEGETLQLSAQASNNVIRYLWSPALYLDRTDVPNPRVTPEADITYRLEVVSDKGCIAWESVKVKVLKKLKVPNTFTPNGDLVNDFWVIDFLNEYPESSVDVFTRQGRKVFSSRGYPNPWDGRANGADLPAGTYYYIIEPKSGRKPVSGYVSIVR
ncbi:PKD domain-containing protein [Pedobacter sp. SYSU D00535]|uniref:PKD domain-containing protein n=1 Tax=Pedobacter sp. SYSU D00535 TaxID=2810308 RepID=UPI001A97AEA4|nr:PKD domain-containing protein [Pedobacter sp. SYSU D00535]